MELETQGLKGSSLVFLMNESIGSHFLVLVYNLQVLVFNSYSLKVHLATNGKLYEVVE